jgi:hypothetical protein
MRLQTPSEMDVVIKGYSDIFSILLRTKWQARANLYKSFNDGKKNGLDSLN